jgi:hypothetical protein
MGPHYSQLSDGRFCHVKSWGLTETYDGRCVLSSIRSWYLMFFEAPGLRRHALASSVFLLSALLQLPAVSARAEVLQSDDFESGFGNRTIVSSASVAKEALFNA